MDPPTADTPVLANCHISFTGYDPDDGAYRACGSTLPDSCSVAAWPSSLAEYQSLATRLGAHVEKHVTRRCNLVVAFRGLTRKRLSAEQHGICVVTPDRFMQLASSARESRCSPLPTGTNATGSALPIHTAVQDTSQTSSSQSYLIRDLLGAYVVPVLYGYVFAATHMTEAETAAMKVLLRQHGAMLQSHLSLRCDALLVTSEYAAELRRHRGRRRWTGCTRAQASNPVVTAQTSSNKENVSNDYRDDDEGKEASELLLSAKVTFAWREGIPVVEFSRLMHLVTRVWSTWQNDSSTCHSGNEPGVGDGGHKSQRDAAMSTTRNALQNSDTALLDFDAIVQLCAIVPPPSSPLLPHSDASLMSERGPACVNETQIPSSSRSYTSKAECAAREDTGADEEECVSADYISGSEDDEFHVTHDACAVAQVARCPPDFTTGAPHDRMISTDMQHHQAEAHARVRGTLLSLSLHEPSSHAQSTPLATCADYYDSSFSRATLTQLAEDRPARLPVPDGGAHKQGIESSHAASKNYLNDGYCATNKDRGSRVLDATKNVVVRRPPATSLVRVADDAPVLHATPGAMASAASVTRAVQLVSTSRGMLHATDDALIPTHQSCTDASADAQTARVILAQAHPRSATPRRTSTWSADTHAGVVRSPVMQAHARVVVVPPMPFFVLHPPHLSLTLLGCTAAQWRRCVSMCAACRFVRTPRPTARSDVIVLGSAWLVRKRRRQAPHTHGQNQTQDDREHHTAEHQPHEPAHDECARADAAEVPWDPFLSPRGPSAASARTARWSRTYSDSHDTQKAGESCTERNGLVRVTRGGGEEEEDREEANHPASPPLPASASTARSEWTWYECSRVVLHALHTRFAIAPERVVPVAWLTACYRRVQEKRRRSWAAARTLHAEGDMDTRRHPRDVSATPPSRTGGEDALPDPTRRMSCAEPRAISRGTSPDFDPRPPLRPSELPSPFAPRYRVRAAAAARSHPSAAHGRGDGSAGGAEGRNTDCAAAEVRHEWYPVQREAGGVSAAPGAPTTDEPVEGQVRRALGVCADMTCTARPGGGGDGAAAAMDGGDSAAAAMDGDDGAAAATVRATRLLTQMLSLLPRTDAAAAPPLFAPCVMCFIDGAFTRSDLAVVRGLVRFGGGCVVKKPASAWRALLSQTDPIRRCTPTRTHAPARSATLTTRRMRALHDATTAAAEVAAMERGAVAVVRWTVRLGRRFGGWHGEQSRLPPVPTALSSAAAHDATTDMLTPHAQRTPPPPPPTRSSPTRTPWHAGAAHGGQSTTAPASSAGCALGETGACAPSPITPALHVVPHCMQASPAAMSRSPHGQAGRKRRRRRTGRPSAAAAAAATMTTTGPCRALRHLPRVTSDYLLACLACRRLLSPHSFFLFDTVLSNAPDLLLMQHARAPPQRHTPPPSPTPPRPSSTCGGSSSSRRVRRGGAEPPPSLPALSAAVWERRYAKAHCVGVSVFFLWHLPCAETATTTTTTTTTTTPPRVGALCAGEVAETGPADVPAHGVTEGGGDSGGLVDDDDAGTTTDPCARALCRVLAYSLQNAVHALGGSVQTRYARDAVTHVVLVDVAAIAASDLRDWMAHGGEGEKEGTGTRRTMWQPAQAYRAVCADAHAMSAPPPSERVAVVSAAWLADCVRWGIFVDETAPAYRTQSPVTRRRARAAASSASLSSPTATPLRRLQRPRRECPPGPSSTPSRSDAPPPPPGLSDALSPPPRRQPRRSLRRSALSVASAASPHRSVSGRLPGRSDGGGVLARRGAAEQRGAGEEAACGWAMDDVAGVANQATEERVAGAANTPHRSSMSAAVTVPPAVTVSLARWDPAASGARAQTSAQKSAREGATSRIAERHPAPRNEDDAPVGTTVCSAGTRATGATDTTHPAAAAAAHRVVGEHAPDAGATAPLRVYVLHDVPRRRDEVSRLGDSALRLVAQCEDAEVLVTHVLHLRESVLLAAAAGMWVVTPHFLTRAAELLALPPARVVVAAGCGRVEESGTTDTTTTTTTTDDDDDGGGGGGGGGRDQWVATRLRRLLEEEEWCAEMLPHTAAALDRGLAHQCRRRRLDRQLRGRRVFDGVGFVLCYGAAASTTRKRRAVQRLIAAGGGSVCAVRCLCPARRAPATPPLSARPPRRTHDSNHTASARAAVVTGPNTPTWSGVGADGDPDRPPQEGVFGDGATARAAPRLWHYLSPCDATELGSCEATRDTTSPPLPSTTTTSYDAAGLLEDVAQLVARVLGGVDEWQRRQRLPGTPLRCAATTGPIRAPHVVYLLMDTDVLHAPVHAPSSVAGGVLHEAVRRCVAATAAVSASASASQTRVLAGTDGGRTTTWHACLAACATDGWCGGALRYWWSRARQDAADAAARAVPACYSAQNTAGTCVPRVRSRSPTVVSPPVLTMHRIIDERAAHTRHTIDAWEQQYRCWMEGGGEAAAASRLRPGATSGPCAMDEETNEQRACAEARRWGGGLTGVTKVEVKMLSWLAWTVSGESAAEHDASYFDIGTVELLDPVP